jgi:hypothetical protein
MHALADGQRFGPPAEPRSTIRRTARTLARRRSSGIRQSFPWSHTIPPEIAREAVEWFTRETQHPEATPQSV